MVNVSVIIPVYNAEQYLGRCIESVLNQSYKNFEIICINDVSKDNSLTILEKYAKNDSRIKVFNNTGNKGAALTRNIGLDNAQGKYIYFIDADDYIDKKYIECMVSAIEKSGTDIVLNVEIESGSKGKTSKFHHPSMPKISENGEYFDKITTIHDAPCFIWARIYKKNFIDKYNLRFLDIKATDDVVFNAITSIYCDKTFVFYGEKYHYTVNEQSVTGNAKAEDNRDLQHIKAHYMIYKYLKEHKIFDERLKLFRVYPFMTVNTKEKFDYYKMFFETIENDYKTNIEQYNDMEKYFADSIFKSSNYDEYLQNHNKIVTIGYLRRNKCLI